MDPKPHWFDQPQKAAPMQPKPLTLTEILDTVRWATKQRNDYIKLLLANVNFAGAHPFDIGIAAVAAANDILLLTQGK